MGVVTFSIDDKLNKKFRDKVSEVYGVGKGNLSKAIEEAIKLWLKEVSKKKKQKSGMFIAKLNEKAIAKARTLKELAEILKKKNISPRDVIITKTDFKLQKEYLGLRVRSKKVIK